MSGKTTVLLADDHPGILAAVSKYLEKHGLEVLAHARDGHEALEQIREQLPTIALLDIRMPGMSGLDLYDRVRADPRFRSLPIVFETGTGREHAAELRARGIATYIKKPFDLDELVRFVKRLMPPRNDNPKPAS